MTNHFETLAKINVNEHVEKKGKFSYLSWAWAVDVLRRAEPTATWEVIRFNGMPFMETKFGIFVEVAVTVQSITLSQIHPVLDNNNRPIEQPNSFQINTSIQRALVKAIALHGLGLYIYSGEDLPNDEEPSQPQQTAQKPPQSVPQPTPQQSQPQAQQSRPNVSRSLKQEAIKLSQEQNMDWNDLTRVAARVLDRPIKRVVEIQAETDWELILSELKSFNLDPVQVEEGALPF